MAPDRQSFFVFRVGGKMLGLGLAEVDRVLPAARLLEPPRHSPGLAGFLNYRGQVIPVLNLRAILGLPPRMLRTGDRIVLVRAWNGALGFVVDEALGVHESSRMQPFPAHLESLQISPSIEGFVPLGDKMVIIENLQKFLASGLAGLPSALQEASGPVEGRAP